MLCGVGLGLGLKGKLGRAWVMLLGGYTSSLPTFLLGEGEIQTRDLSGTKLTHPNCAVLQAAWIEEVVVYVTSVQN